MHQVELHNALINRFTVDELHTLCFSLKIHYENLSSRLSILARELIEECIRSKRIPELIDACKTVRPGYDDWIYDEAAFSNPSQPEISIDYPQRKGCYAQLGKFKVALVLMIPIIVIFVATSQIFDSDVSTATPTQSLALITLTPSPSFTPTATVNGPYIQLLPNCGSNSPASFTVIGGNWPTSEIVDLYWSDPSSTNQYLTSINAPHSGTFSINLSQPIVSGTTYQVHASTSTIPLGLVTANFHVPCANILTPTLESPITSTPVPNATDTPTPPDLVIVGQPQLVSPLPIIGYQPVTFSVVISNTGGFDVNGLFFVNIYIDPTQPITPGISVNVPLSERDGYTSVNSLARNASKVITITAKLGFGNIPENHLVYGMVDAMEQVAEGVETNNISLPTVIVNVTPGATPTP